jgi:UDP-N-acetylmuramoyl-L-alanyl-D-glutamate--2,6-diaminopimelate ligase
MTIRKIKNDFTKLIPTCWLSVYHLTLSKLGAWLYGYPSEKLVVIGVTGTSGKSTAVFILHNLLKNSGYKVGSLSTIAFWIDQSFQLNNRKMTMLGRFQIQKFMSRMVKSGCYFAIIETTSQGIEQYRHRGIHYDLLLFTNLYPEHIEAHGGFENYKKAKLKLFEYLAQGQKKNIDGQTIPRTIVVNGDDEKASDFLNFPVEKKYAFSFERTTIKDVNSINIENVLISQAGVDFQVAGHDFHSPLHGSHNVKNVAAAITVARSFDLSWEALRAGVQNLPPIPGRLEYIKENQPWDMVIDYAFEPRAMENLYEAIRPLGYKKIIQVLGGTGGGRDKARRPNIGRMAARFANFVIVTNEDPYDENPKEIMEQVKIGAQEGGKEEGRDLFVVEDRRQAIHKAFLLAESGSLVLITGKGCEQAIAGPGGSLIPWDDRQVAREEIKKIIGNK